MCWGEGVGVWAEIVGEWGEIRRNDRREEWSGGVEWRLIV